MKAYKWPAHRIFILAFIVTFGCAPLYSIAEDEISLVSGENSPTIAEKMDAIGFEYSEDENGDVEASLVIDGEKTVFAILPWKDKGSLQIASLYSKNDIHSLRCIVSPECQGAELKSAIYSFVHAVSEFRSSEIKYSKEFTSGKSTENSQSANASIISDLNIIPEQYRDSNSKVTAWLKQQGLEGKPVSIKAIVSSIGPNLLDFMYEYDAGDSSPLRFDAMINNYSPLDYNEGEIYIINGRLTMPEYGMWPFTISQATLQRVK